MKSSGFSLLELLITLSLVIMLTTLIFPSQSFFVNKTKSDALKLQLLNAIKFAQQQSQVLGDNISICPREQDQCGNDWNKGEIVFVDRKEKGIIANASDIIFKFPNQHTKGNLSFRSARKIKYLSFNIRDENNNGTFYYYLPNKTKPEWALVISESGRARIKENL